MSVKLKYHVAPEVLAERYNNPPRREIPPSVTQASGQWSSDELWNELLRLALIPERFANDQNRRFGRSDQQTEIWPDCRMAETLVPTLASDIMAVASDPMGMLAAEESAREFAVRLLPWKAVCNYKIVWQFDKKIDRYWGRFGVPVMSASDSVLWSTYDVFGATHFLDYMPELDQRKIPLSPHVLKYFASYETWFVVSDLRLPIEYPESMDFSAWDSIADLKNPFEPLVDIWLRGYRILPEFTSEDPFIRLYATTLVPHELSSNIHSPDW
jgi:hypothetical protein